MNNDKSLQILFSHVPNKYIPQPNTKACYLLREISDGNIHERLNLIQHPKLGEALRSPLQLLRGDELGWWNVVSVPIEGTKTSGLQLDPRHLSGCAKLDSQARKERRKAFKAKSKADAIHGRIREPKAIREFLEATAEYFNSV